MVVPLFLILIFTILISLVYASYEISSGFYVKAYCRKKTTEKVVALTFDDGPHPENTEKVLSVLKRWEVEAAFFCIGENVKKYPSLAERMFIEGHLIGNHSYSHVNSFPLLKKEKMVQDIRKADDVIYASTGVPVHYFRPPFGITNPLVKKALKHFDYYVIGWSIRSFDTTTDNVEKIVARIERQIKPGAVILMHDRLPYSAEVLERVLTFLTENGYEVKRVDKLFNII